MWATGTDSASAGDLVLNGAYLGPNKPGLYFQGNNSVSGGNGVPFGDGLRCAGGQLRRLELLASSGGGTSQTTINIPAQGGGGRGPDPLLPALVPQSRRPVRIRLQPLERRDGHLHPVGGPRPASQ